MHSEANHTEEAIVNQETGTQGIHVLGIRHHGPGSARSVRNYLERLRPDIVLVEGPPEADEILQWVSNEALKPPVALLVYQPDNPKQSVVYPFAVFSPEWQAITFGKANNIPVRFIDLPMFHQFAIEAELAVEEKVEPPTQEATDSGEATEELLQVEQRRDPIGYLAEAAGFNDGETWWEQMFEFRKDDEDVFTAIAEAMHSLRNEIPIQANRMEQLREAFMRKQIRQAQREMYTTIAVICGAWHAPALIQMPKQKEDTDLLKGLPKVKTDVTWIPWTYSRLSYASGYGAGIPSPGWYDHTWHHTRDDGSRWMAKVASLFREKGMDTSVAHVIEAVKLAEGLSSLRGFSKAGLAELNESTLSILCHGEPLLMQLVHQELIVSNRLGEVPEDIPKPPLQNDISKLQKTLRLQPTADFKDYTLDLRKEMDLERSKLLHRLLLLGIAWGEPSMAGGKGTFKEQWRLQWQPEFSVLIIEKGSWGNTVEEAANNFIIQSAQGSSSIAEIAALLEKSIPAELNKGVEVLISQLNNLAATNGDVLQLVSAIPPLVNIVRYGNVRNTDADMVLQIIRSLSLRVCIGLTNAVMGLNDEAARALIPLIASLHDAFSILQEEQLDQAWSATLLNIADTDQAAAIVSGYCTRLLTNQKILEGEALVKKFYYRMSVQVTPDQSAAWLEGFLKGSGTILLLDQELWSVVNQWVHLLSEETFIEVLPLLRRTFSEFNAVEKRKLGEKVKLGDAAATPSLAQTGIDPERAKRGIPIILQLLNITPAQTTEP
jgi:hypothetical protein